ncbi:MAG: hypothetical protein EXR05_01515 [Acetobacteraceae bacterium]|nr:hypothetical protein [Acetobacteraceae bacterium]MSP29164.1 hypothetical protein [Acetobacteraceae bacterium]
MKCIDLSAYGIPEQVAHCVDVADVGTPRAGDRTSDGWRIGFLLLTRLRIDPLAQPAPRGDRALLPHSPDWLTGA